MASGGVPAGHHRRLSRIATAGLVLGIAVAAFPPPAPADGVWLVPAILGEDTTAQGMVLRTKPDGRSAVLWGTGPSGGDLSVGYSTGSFWRAAENVNRKAASMWDMALIDQSAPNPIIVYVTTAPGGYTINLTRTSSSQLTTWTESLVNVSTGQITDLQVFSSFNNVTVVWTAFDGSYYSLFARTWYSSNSSMGGLSKVSFTAQNVGSFSAAADARGSGLVIYTQGSPLEVYAAYWSTAFGWSGTAILTGGVESAVPYPPPVLDMDPGGNATVEWQQDNATNSTVLVSRMYGSNYTWTSPTPIANYALGAIYPWNAMIASARQGAAVVMWSELDTTTFASYGTRVVRFTVSGGWGPVETVPGVSGGWTDVAADSDGSFAILRGAFDGTAVRSQLQLYSAARGWLDLLPFETINPGVPIVNGLALQSMSDGFFAAAWIEYTGPTLTIASRRLRPDWTPPALDVAEPSEGATVGVAAVTVAGTTEPGVRLAVNGIQAVVGPDGSFSIPLSLSPGATTIEITADDGRGNSPSVWRNVTFVDPVPGLETDLASAQGTLTQLRVDLAAANASLAVVIADVQAAQTEVAEARTNLSQAQSELVALSSALNTTTAGLGDARAELTSAQGVLTALEADGSATAEELAQARANVSAAQSDVDALEAQQVSLANQLAMAGSNASAAALRVDALAARLDTTALQVAAAFERANATKAELDALKAGGSAPSGDNGLALAALVVGLAGVGLGAIAVVRARPRSERPSTGGRGAPEPKGPERP